MLELWTTTPLFFLSLFGLLFFAQYRAKIEAARRGTNQTPADEPMALTAQKASPLNSQLDQIRFNEIPELVEHLPANSWHKENWYKKGDRWRFTFECNSESRRFFATALGATPMEAFLITRHRITAQIRDWHQSRFETTPPTIFQAGESPRVLIVDDDVDMALAMQEAFGQLGCQTEVVTRHEGLHRKLVSSQADYIFLDWRLNDEVTAGQVVAKANRYIDTFSDLRQQFTDFQPRVITHSILDRGQIALPHTGTAYFAHLDHWQKPMPFEEVIKRATQLLASGPARVEV